ncbi:hypothetical protein ACFPU1_12960 [Thalassorhabdus alkalitolerans]|uniref:Uncharacterized protein n=1 Tax=Thalassorhabdus alkalitolerans TaxID=2282697 RepID=A0ABW0YMM4_9BACI
MPKVFKVPYKGHEVKVENRWFAGEKLYINGQLQDENVGLALRATLRGKIPSEGGNGEEIKVVLGGIMKIKCRIFADHVLIYPSQHFTTDR